MSTPEATPLPDGPDAWQYPYADAIPLDPGPPPAPRRGSDDRFPMVTYHTYVRMAEYALLQGPVPFAHLLVPHGAVPYVVEAMEARFRVVVEGAPGHPGWSRVTICGAPASPPNP